jgi:phage tail sheath protein FI
MAMAEYLSPDVYIEEPPSSLQAIESVSTSTAAFVGRARRGTVPGYVWPGSGTPNLPFTPTGGFVLTPDPAPVLVTSFADFQRQFGPPWPIPLPGDPTDYGYLGWAAKAFFDNGGKRVYIARIVDPGDTPSTVRASQGVVYRLLRSASAGDGTSVRPLFFTSTRGLNVNDTLTFKRHSDGTNPLGSPDTPAIVVGTSGTSPFALLDGDQLSVTTNTPVAVASVTIVAKPASVKTTGTVPFNIPDGATLELRVGPATAPVQVIIFSSTDPNFPITAGAATLNQVQAVLSAYTSGLNISQQANEIVLESVVHGTNARIEVVGGSAAAATALNLPLGPASPPAGNSFPDASQVTTAQLAGLLTSANFTVDEAQGHLRFTTAAAGGGVTIQVSEGVSGVLQRLGFGTVSSVKATGAAATPSTVQIASYDLQSNSIVLTTPLTGPLDVNDVSATVSAPSSGTGPKFLARTPGSWSGGLTIAIANSDRAATQVTGPVASGASNVPVQSVAGLYVGAVIEVDHNGASRSIHQITSINSSTRVITIDPLLGSPLKVVVNPATDKPAWVRALEVDITVTDTTGAAPTEVYRGMAWNQDPNFADLRRHYAWSINARSRLVWVQPPGVGSLSGSEGNTLTSQPTTSDGFPVIPDTLGTESFNYDDQTYIGADNGPGARSGIQSFLDLSEARIIAAPGNSSQTVQVELIDQCELLRFRFAILDGELDPAGGSITSILTHRSLYDTSYASYYQPWLAVTVDGQTRYLPPSGYLAGIYARVDDAQGPWKAPANEPVLNVIGLKTYFTSGEQDLLNPRGVNLIREFDVGGIRVWGARTLSSDPNLVYVNVRRALILFEASIAEGTRNFVFASNTPDTWSRVTNSVSAFLLTQWRNGALFGTKPEQAFFVRCDETTMTSDDILNGRMITVVGVAIVRPAEFVIFRVQQITDFGASTS